MLAIRAMSVTACTAASPCLPLQACTHACTAARTISLALQLFQNAGMPAIVSSYNLIGTIGIRRSIRKRACHVVWLLDRRPKV